MIKTQIQAPEKLFAEIKDFARQREWSLAETFRRGAELLLETYTDEVPSRPGAWNPPTSRRVGWKSLTAEQLRDLSFEDQARKP